MVDIVLGLDTPSSGFAKISGQSPRFAIRTWPDKIACVPQRTILFNGTFVENVNYERPYLTEDQIWQALRNANLDAFVKSSKRQTTN